MARRRNRRSRPDPTSSSKDASDDEAQRPAKRARVGPAGPSVSANSKKKRLPRDHYTLAWICALYHELFAARRMLDEEHQEHSSSDDNHYIFGRVAKHNVIIACLPEGHYGTVRATRVLTELRNSYPSVKRCLLVGIGGGFPNLPSNDIRLGDVLVGRQIVSYDEGKQHSDGHFEITGDTIRPSKSMLTALSMLRAKLEDSATATVLVDTVQARLPGETQYHRPNADDILFSSNVGQVEVINRLTRPSPAPHVHYGTIASGNTLIKDSKLRDRLALQLNVIGTEMEAGGLMGIMPLLVIRGVSDYSDSHKNDVWQKYAAANAAAFAREYLEVLAAPKIARDTDMAPIERPTLHKDHTGVRLRRENVLESLRFDQMTDRLWDIPKKHGSTCIWLLQHEKYKAWLNDADLRRHRGFIWLTGNPGAGKSTIMKFAYEHHKGRIFKCGTAKIRVGSFFFHARGEDLQKSVGGMFRSLVVQLLEAYPDLQELLDDSELFPRSDSTCPSEPRALELFRRGISRLRDRQFVCYIDALDECSKDQAATMVKTFRDLAKQHNNESPRLRIFFSSRHYPEIDTKSGLNLILEKLPGHVEDLRKYIRSCLRYKMKDLREEILIKANGVFMWVVLVVEILNDHYGQGLPKSIALEKLAELPGDLSKLFSDILKRYGGNMDQFAVGAAWLLFAQRPLSPAEFDHAVWSDTLGDGSSSLAIPSDGSDSTEEQDRRRRRVVSVMKGLAEIKKHRKRVMVQFIHESVRDFLLKDNGLAQILGVAVDEVESRSHERLKCCCNNYLGLPELQATIAEADGAKGPHLVPIEGQYPFMRYAVDHVLHHAEKSEPRIPQSDFLSNFRTKLWLRIRNMYKPAASLHRFHPDTDMLYLLAQGGYNQLIRRCGKRLSMNCDSLGPYGSPLIAAFDGQGAETLSALLEDPGISCEREDLISRRKTHGKLSWGKGHTLLSWAAAEGRPQLAQLLLQKGASITALDPDGHSPLSRACQLPTAARGVMAMFLLDHGAEWKSSAAVRGTYLQGGQARDSKRRKAYATNLCRLLIVVDRRSDLLREVLDTEGGVDLEDLLVCAAGHGRAKIVDMLLKRGVDLAAKRRTSIGIYPMTYDPLGSALSHHHYDLAKLLVDWGADVWSGSKWDNSAFWHAVKGGDHLMLDWLIYHSRGDEQWHLKYQNEPLATAACCSRISMAERLIKAGADISGRDADGDTPLLRACSRGSAEMAEVLLAWRANVHLRDNRGRTPLVLACCRWGENATGIIPLLLRAGADVNEKMAHGRTALMWAAEWAQTDKIQLLIENGADVRARLDDGRTALDLVGRLNPTQSYRNEARDILRTAARY